MMNSKFAAKIEAMLELRIADGLKSGIYPKTLAKFDAYCLKNYPESSVLSQNLVNAWLESEILSNCEMKSRSQAIRRLGQYLCAIGENAYVLPEKYTAYKPVCNPTILTDCEMTALFKSIDRLKAEEAEPFLNEIAPVIFRLIYTCGLRPNEGRELLTDNVNLKTGEILITHTKMNKERIVVMSDDMLGYAKKYDLKRSIFGNSNPYFFPSSNGGALSTSKLYTVLNRAWLPISTTEMNPVPKTLRVVDLRHRFASACLNRWLDESLDLNVMLPYLRTYMGHDNLSETAYYIHILPENLVKSSAVDWEKLNSIMPELPAESEVEYA